MDKTTTKPKFELPARLEPFGGIGWTICEFADARAAAAFVVAHPSAAMPCWRRFDIVDGALMVVR